MAGQKVCQFGAQWPPKSKTLILRPFEGEDLLQAEQYKNVYADVQVFLEELSPDPGDMTFEEFLAKVGVSETVYILPYRVFT